MRGKPIRSKNKILVALVALFTMLMCTSVGFAAWITTGGSTGSVNGNIEADDVIGGGSGDVDVITIDSLQDYQYKQSYGFVDDGVFGATVVLTGQCTFDAAAGKQSISSFRNNKKFGLDVELTTALSGGFSANNMTSSSISLTSSNFTTVSVTPTSGQSITGTLGATCSDNNSNFTFTFSITLNWTGSNLSSFPDISSAGFSVSLLPKEFNAQL